MRNPGRYLAAFIGFYLMAFAGLIQAQIVAFGASNVAGYGVSPSSAYPAQLEKMLGEKGYRVHVSNAGKSGDTTSGMLRRLDSAVPSGTRIVILDTSGGLHNDVKHGATREQGEANMRAIEDKLKSRDIAVIPASTASLPATYRQADRVHLNAEGHRLFAEQLFPEVTSALDAAGLGRK